MLRERPEILVALDGDGRADEALAAGRALSTLFAGRLHVVHVVERRGGFWRRVPEPGLEWLREHGEGVIGASCSRVFSAEEVLLRTHVRSGHPVREIESVAREIGCDLLLVGRHVRGRFDPLLGGTAQRLLLRRPCSLLVQKGPLPAEGFREILVGTDLSPESLGAVRMARDWARRMEARLHVAHVFEPPDFAYDATVAMPSYSIEAVRKSSASDYAARMAEIDFEGVEATFHDLEGEASSELMGLVHRTACDLLVVGGHGHGALEQLLLGTTAETLVRNASCSVLVT